VIDFSTMRYVDVETTVREWHAKSAITMLIQVSWVDMETYNLLVTRVLFQEQAALKLLLGVLCVPWIDDWIYIWIGNRQWRGQTGFPDFRDGIKLCKNRYDYIKIKLHINFFQRTTLH